MVYVDSDTITYEEAARILLDICALFDNANIPFRAIDFVLEAPLPEEGPRTEDDIRIEDFRYEEIYEEGLADRIAEAHAQREAFHAAQDDK